MDTNQIGYDYEASDARIKEILDAGDQTFEELDYIPALSRLTHSNGFYVSGCGALFIDIRGSSQMASNHTRPVLGKIYRAYLSECVAIMNQYPNCKQVYINGDCVSGIFETSADLGTNDALYCAAELHKMLDLLNWRLEQKGYTTIKCGIGLAHGRALMLKAGFKGSGINEVVWMGDVVNEASNLCNRANKLGRKPILVSTAAYSRLMREDYQSLLSPIYEGLLFTGPSLYEADIYPVAMGQWLNSKRGLGSVLSQGAVNLADLLYPKKNDPFANGLAGLHKKWF